jgi:hypothetical protein
VLYIFHTQIFWNTYYSQPLFEESFSKMGCCVSECLIPDVIVPSLSGSKAAQENRVYF